MVEKKPSTLSRETLMPIGAVVAVCAAFLSGALWINSKLGELSWEVRSLKSEVANIKSREAPTTQEIQLWIRLFAAQNPDVSIPQFPQ